MLPDFRSRHHIVYCLNGLLIAIYRVIFVRYSYKICPNRLGCNLVIKLEF